MTDNQGYGPGAMVLLNMQSAVVSISNESAVTYGDYMIDGDEVDDGFNLTNLTSSRSTYRWYFQVMAVVARSYYQYSLNLSKEFDTFGTYNLTATIYDPISQYTYFDNVFPIIGIYDYIYFYYYYFILVYF